MFTNTKSVLSVAIMLGTASVALAAPRYPTDRQAGAITRTQVPTSTYGSDSLPQAPGQITRMSAEYFNPNPATFKAFTYCASVPLGPSISKRVLQGEFRFPALSVRRQMYRYKLFLQPPLPRCRSTPSESKKFLGPRAPPKHKSSLRQKRSLMSPRTGFIMQI